MICPDCNAEDEDHERWCPVAKDKARRLEYRETLEATLPPLMGRLGPDLVVRPCDGCRMVPRARVRS